MNIDPQTTIDICAAASPGPWSAKDWRICAIAPAPFEFICDTATSKRSRNGKNAFNAEFIAHARTALPLYAQEVLDSRARIAALEAENERLKNGLFEISATSASSKSRDYHELPNKARRLLDGETPSMALNLIGAHMQVRDKALADKKSLEAKLSEVHRLAVDEGNAVWKVQQIIELTKP